MAPGGEAGVLDARPDETGSVPSEPARRRPRRRAPWPRTLLLALLNTVPVAMLCTAVLETSVWWGSAETTWYAFFRAGYGFILGSLVLWVVLLWLLCLTGRWWLSVALLLDLVLVLAIVTRLKLDVREEPLYPSDLDFVTSGGFLLDMAGVTKPLLLLGLLAGVVAAGVLLGRRLARRFPPLDRRTRPRAWRRVLVVRLLGLALTTLLLAQLPGFNQPGNGWRALYESKNVQWAFWYQRLNYQQAGFVGGFLYNMPIEAMAEPAGYDEAAMADLVERYRPGAAQQNAAADPGVLRDTNVVVVLNEAFSDPGLLDGIVPAEDPIPLTRELMAQTPSGAMLAQLYGGGTANMEFEALSGMSIGLFRPQMTTPYQMLVPDYETFPNATRFFADLGYETAAVHPYFTGMYKRNAVYPILGFEEFVSEADMGDPARIDDSDFVSDAATFDEVRRRIKGSDDPVFLNVVTMQNHWPMVDSYDDPIDVEGVPDAQSRGNVTHYLRGLKHTDRALADLLADLQELDEPTAVVFFGDHQPGIYPDEVTERGDNPRKVLETPFLLWSSEGNRAVSMPLTSPIYFLPLLLRELDAPLPTYYRMLLEAWEELPAMEKGEFFGPDGVPRAEEDLTPEQRAVLADLRLAQYDQSIGERWSVEGLWEIATDDGTPPR